MYLLCMIFILACEDLYLKSMNFHDDARCNYSVTRDGVAVWGMIWTLVSVEFHLRREFTIFTNTKNCALNWKKEEWIILMMYVVIAASGDMEWFEEWFGSVYRLTFIFEENLQSSLPVPGYRTSNTIWNFRLKVY